MSSDYDAVSVRASRDRQLLGGVAWSAGARTISQLATWAISLLVARLLTPGDFGVVSAATAYLGLVALITEFGLRTAVVSQRDLPEEYIAQLGGLALGLGLCAWAITAALSPFIAHFLDIKELTRVLPVLGLATAFSSLNALPFALLQKQLRFRTLANVEVFKTLTSALILLALAWLDFGYWSLVLNEVVAIILTCVVLYMLVRYRIAVPRRAQLSSSLRISRQVLIARVGWYTYSNADFAIVARTAGKQSLGDYSMAWNLTTMPSQKIAGMIMGVTAGIFASVQNELPELQRYFLRISEFLSILLVPATIGLGLVAPELVLVVLGKQWVNAAPLITYLSLATAIRSIGPVCSQVLLARLRADVEMRYTLLSAIILPLGFLLASRYGVGAVALSWSVMSVPLVAYQIQLTCQELEISPRRLLPLLAKPILATTLMSLTVLGTRRVLAPHVVDAKSMLIALVCAGVVSYGILAALLMSAPLRAMARMVRSRR